MDRLSKFEKMLNDIISKLAKETEIINKLKNQEMENSISYKFTLDKQSTYMQMIKLYKEYELIEKSNDSMKNEDNNQEMVMSNEDLINILEDLLVCLYEKWFYLDDDYVFEGFDQCKNYLYKRGPQGLVPFYEWIEDELDYELLLPKEKLYRILYRKLND